MITENLSTLKINKLTQEQYNRELDAGRIDEHAIYLTPGEEIDLSDYVRCYTSIEDIGLTPPVTTEQICEAMPIYSKMLLAAGDSTITDLPANWGTLEISRANWNYCTAKFTQSSTTGLYTNLGKYASNIDPKWSGWKLILTRPTGEGDVFINHHANDTSNRTVIHGGTAYNDGASIYLNGSTKSGNEGEFALVAHNGSQAKTFLGKADGSLTWNGNTFTLGNNSGRIFSNVNQMQMISLNTTTTEQDYRMLALRNRYYVSNVGQALSLIDTINGKSTGYTVFGAHNKPSGSYVGNGATNRSISLGDGIMGNAVYIWASDLSLEGFAFRNAGFAWINQESSISVVKSNVSMIDGGLYFGNNTLNQSGKTYYYQVL